MSRIPVSKSKRFDIFARDGFTCQYCGQRPPDVILEVDHIEAVALGGTNEDLNLITSCSDCNRGKSAKRISEIRPRPDADIEYLKVEQETAEVRRYLDAKKERDKAFSKLVKSLSETWAEYISPGYLPDERQWRQWIIRYSPEEIEHVIHKVSGKYRSGQIRDGVRGAMIYISGVLKKRQEEDGA